MRVSGCDFGVVFGFPLEVVGVGLQLSQILAVIQIVNMEVA